MTIKNKYFSGTTTSRYLSPSDASWDSTVYQSGKPILDAELNLSPDITKEVQNLLLSKTQPSGFINTGSDTLSTYTFQTTSDPKFIANGFRLNKITALVANNPIVVEYTNTDVLGENLIVLDTAPVKGGTAPDVKRSDFVFLETYKTMVAPSPHGSGSVEVLDPVTVVGGDTISINGIPLTAVVGVPAVDEFEIGVSATITAGNIRDAINNVSNSFTSLVTAQLDISNVNKVLLRSVVGGTLGNYTFTTSNPAGLSLDPLTGNLSGGVDRPHKPSQDTIYRYGNTQSSLNVALVDNIEDPVLNTESTQRVQVQYRVRTTGQTEAVNFKTQNGFSNPSVFTQGSQTSPITSFNFVPADGVSVKGFINVLSTPLIVGDVITINGIDLVGVSGARTPGSNDFDVTVSPTTALATEIDNALTDPLNSFSTLINTSVNTDKITLTLNTATNLTLSTTSVGVSVGVSSAVSYGIKDTGLFIAGDGTLESAQTLGTVDGYVYAIPMCFVFRRNDASTTGGFDPLNNTNGALPHNHGGFSNLHGLGTIPATESDRPDQHFHDVIVDTDVLDLRRSINFTRIDYKRELERQMAMLLDGSMKTWAIDSADKNELGAGSGDISWRFLVCNEVGRDSASGGVAPISGDTTRGDTVGNFDHIRRRFSAEAIVERVTLPILPTDTNTTEPGKYVSKPTWAAGFNGWAEGDVIHVDLDNLNASGLGDWSNATSSLVGGVVSNFYPPGTKITNVLGIVLDDGNFTTPVSLDVEVAQIQGVGTNHVEIHLMPDTTLVNGGVSGNPTTSKVALQSGGLDNGSQRRVFFELEITYPVGSGTTDTPDEVLQPSTSVPEYFGPTIENDNTQRPYDWEGLPTTEFRQGKRELDIEYVAGGDYTPTTGLGTLITEEVISVSNTEIVLPRRIWGDTSYTPIVEDLSSGAPVGVTLDVSASEFGSSSRKLVLDLATPLGSNNALVRVQFYAQDAIPNFGGVGGGYQLSTYYRSNAPQTLATQAGVVPLPISLTLKPLVMSRDLWTSNVSVGSVDLPFPYTNPNDQIAVNGDLSGSSFPGEWVLQAQGKISLSDFDVESGLLNLHTVVPVDPNTSITVTDVDKDSEFRAHYKVSDPSAYRPTAFGRSLSGLMKHKVWLPMLATSTVDSVYFRKGEVLLVVFSRFAELDNENSIIFEDINNTSSVAVYRTTEIIIEASER